MLILFDIDATLLTTGGAGITAMGHAGRAMLGEHFDEREVEFAGRLDPLIIADLLAAHAVDPTPQVLADFRRAYHHHLSMLLNRSSISRPCPGALQLLAALERIQGITLGLLTGNFPETGTLKLRAGGIDPELFAVAAWGCDSPIQPPAREHLPPVAMKRYRTRFGRELAGADVTIVGDTPHDVACAKAHGCRALAVGTGMFGLDDLARSGADRVVSTLDASDDIARWLATPTPP